MATIFVGSGEWGGGGIGVTSPQNLSKSNVRMCNYFVTNSSNHFSSMASKISDKYNTNTNNTKLGNDSIKFLASTINVAIFLVLYNKMLNSRVMFTCSAYVAS